MFYIIFLITGVCFLLFIFIGVPKIYGKIIHKLAVIKYEREILKTFTYKFANSTFQEDVEPYEITKSLSFNSIEVKKMIARMTDAKKWEFVPDPDPRAITLVLRLNTSSQWMHYQSQFILSKVPEMNYHKRKAQTWINVSRQTSHSYVSTATTPSATISRPSATDIESQEIQKKILSTQKRIAASAAQSAFYEFQARKHD